MKLDKTLAASRVIHSIPGRVRLRMPALKAHSRVAASLEALLADQPGMAEVSVNGRCQSVTVVYDPTVWTADSICGFLQELTGEEVEAYRPTRVLPDEARGTDAAGWLQPWRLLEGTGEGPNPAGGPPTGGSVKPSYRIMGYTSLMVGIVGLVVPLLPGIPFLLLSSYCFAKVTSLQTGDGPEAGEQVPKATE